MPISTWQTPLVLSSTLVTLAALNSRASTSLSRSASMTARLGSGSPAASASARSWAIRASSSVVLPAPGLAMTSVNRVPSALSAARKASAAASLFARISRFTSMTTGLVHGGSPRVLWAADCGG